MWVDSTQEHLCCNYPTWWFNVLFQKSAIKLCHYKLQAADSRLTKLSTIHTVKSHKEEIVLGVCIKVAYQ